MELVYPTDSHLVEALRTRKEDAYIYILDLYGNRILRTCSLILKDEKLAEDIVQDTFLEVFKSIRKFKENSSLYTWIYRIAVNKCRNLLRKNEREIVKDELIEFISEEPEEDILIERIQNVKVKEAVFSLPPSYREVITLFYFEEFTIKEICAMTDERENTIKSKLYRGRNILRESLEKEGIIYEER